MGYKRADEILPDDILKIVQRYVSGETIYVPEKRDSRKGWGTSTGARKKLYQRNRKILAEYQSGVTIAELANQYFLTEKSIQRILKTIRTEPPMETDKFYQEDNKIE